MSRIKRNTKNKSDGTLILEGLTEEDFSRFHKHRVPYSGSTGASTGPLHSEIYPTGPYIATWMSEFARATMALGWKKVTVEFKEHQALCRKSNMDPFDPALPIASKSIP